MGSLKLNGPVLASKVLCDKDVVAENVKFTLPEITFQTVEFQAMGTMELPIPLTDALEAGVTHIGFDKGFYKMLGLTNKTFEFRFVQNVTKPSGEQKQIGCKAFIKGIAKNIPGGDLEIGSAFEGAITLAVTRYQLFVDGKEVHLVDKLKGICKINGKDYAKGINNLL